MAAKISRYTVLCQYNSKTSFAGYRVINVQTHVNRIHAPVSLIPMQAPPQPGYNNTAVITALQNINSHMNTHIV